MVYLCCLKRFFQLKISTKYYNINPREQSSYMHNMIGFYLGFYYKLAEIGTKFALFSQQRVNMASNYQLGYDDERFETIVNRNFHCFSVHSLQKKMQSQHFYYIYFRQTTRILKFRFWFSPRPSATQCQP